MYGGFPYAYDSYGSVKADKKIQILSSAKILAGSDAVLWKQNHLLSPAQILAKGSDIRFVSIMDVVSSRLNVSSSPVGYHVILPLESANITVQAALLNLSQFSDLTTANVKAKSNPYNINQKLILLPAGIAVSSDPVTYEIGGTIYFDLSNALVRTKADPGAFEYAPIVVIPDLTVSRSGSYLQSFIDVKNPINADIMIYRADNHIGKLELVTKIPINTLPYTDTVQANTNYIYVVYYSTDGEINYIPVNIKSKSSQPRITIGKHRSL